jgi:hypothetical protein
MSDFKGEWEAAKSTFENTTGVKKPAPTKKNVFGKAVRQKVGIGEAFGKVDKLMPDDDGSTMKQKDLEQLGRLISAAAQEVKDYVKMLTEAINAEKDEHGKGAEAIYRDLKILKAKLESSTADMKAQLDKIYVVRRGLGEGLNRKATMFLTNFRTLKSSIDRNGKRALLVVQQLLKDPTPQNFNSSFPKAARDITQNIGQIHKFTLPDELNATALRTRGEALEDPKVAEAVIELEKKVAHFKRETIPLMREAGATPLDATLAKMCNSPPRFLEDATKQDVIAATKHFGRQVKKAMELGQKMI